MLLGYHTLWSQIADIVGTPAQADAFHKLWVSNNYYIGGAVNPRDNDLAITDHGDELSFSGFKHFTTGAAVSDLLVLEGAIPSGEHVFAVVPTKQDGVSFAYNWNNIGLRLTESGSATITDVRVPWADALGWDEKSKKPSDVLQVPFATLLLPLIQLVFSNFYLGIAFGALSTAKAYTTTTTRPWPFGGDVSPLQEGADGRTRTRRQTNSTSYSNTATSTRTSAPPKRSLTKPAPRLRPCWPSTQRTARA